jgi:hypothetical protein
MACLETYATVRIWSNDLTPDEISDALGIEPTRKFGKGELHAAGKLQRKANGWFYSTEQLTDTKEFEQHLDLILRTFKEKAEALKSLRAKNCQMDICTYWVSNGQGGPELSPEQMLALGTLGFMIWWDIYFRE